MDNFYSEFELKDNSQARNAALLTYYTFTTFSTVGLGDLHPVSNSERLVASAVMLFGVMITSFLIENFSSVVDQVKNFNKVYSDWDNLTKFVGTIKKFNKGWKNKETEQEIYTYFTHRWVNDRNFAIATEWDRAFLEQLPQRHIQSLYSTYLFKDFMEEFKSLFEVKAKLIYRRMITYKA